MRDSNRLADGVGFALDDLRIRVRDERWSRPEPIPRHRVVLVRRGCYRLRMPGWEGLVDPVTAYVGRPGDEQSIAHRVGAEDVCTVLDVDEALADESGLQPAGRPVPTSGRVDLAHRVLVTRVRNGADDFEVAEPPSRVRALLGTRIQAPAVRTRRSSYDEQPNLPRLEWTHEHR